MREGVPSLAAFYGKHKDRLDRFEILAIHDSTVKTLEELDIRLAPAVEKVWGGKPLPFPVLVDDRGRTKRAWGVSEVPTVILVDPAGKIVSAGNEETLAEQLAFLEKRLSE